MEKMIVTCEPFLSDDGLHLVFKMSEVIRRLRLRTKNYPESIKLEIRGNAGQPCIIGIAGLPVYFKHP